MGTFATTCQVLNIGDRSQSVSLPNMLVDTGSKFTWAPRTDSMVFRVPSEPPHEKTLSLVVDGNE